MKHRALEIFLCLKNTLALTVFEVICSLLLKYLIPADFIINTVLFTPRVGS